jgi:hypothetical protein
MPKGGSKNCFNHSALVSPMVSISLGPSAPQITAHKLLRFREIGLQTSSQASPPQAPQIAEPTQRISALSAPSAVREVLIADYLDL